MAKAKKAVKAVKQAKKVLVSFIQDRSGSMSSCWEETVNGFKVYVNGLKDDQKKDSEIEYLFTFTAFDTDVEKPYMGVPISQVDDTKIKEFGPRGMTALYDAVGKTMQAIDDDKNLVFDKAIVVIVTDGEENSSREWNKTSLHSAIDERIKRGNWTFTYLGTQPETWGDARGIGMGVGSSAVYDATNAAATYQTMAMASSNMARSASAQSHSFLHENTTKSLRASVGMRTATDSHGGLGSMKKHPAPKPRFTPPAPKPTVAAKKAVSNKKWK